MKAKPIRFLNNFSQLNKNIVGQNTDCAVNNISKKNNTKVQVQNDTTSELDLRESLQMSDLYNGEEFDQSRLDIKAYNNIKLTGMTSIGNENLQMRMNRVRYEYAPSVKWNYHNLDKIGGGKLFDKLSVPQPERKIQKRYNSPKQLRFDAYSETNAKPFLPSLVSVPTNPLDLWMKKNQESTPNPLVKIPIHLNLK